MSEVSERILRLADDDRARLREQLRARGAVAPLAAYAGSAPSSAPTSFSQRRVLFLQGLDPAAAHYHTPLACTLSGPLEVSALDAALQLVIARHAILRTTFPTVGGVPVQRVAPTGSLDVPVVDLAGRPVADQQAEIDGVFTELRSKPFDLAGEPPIRAALVRLAANDHQLLLVFHHLAVDGWSLAVFGHDLAELYAAETDRRAVALAQPLVDFADFSAWQNDWLDTEAAHQQVRYWSRRLVGLPELLTLPTDRPRPPTQTRQGGVVHFELPVELSRQLGSLATARSASPFMILLAGFTVLLSRYSGQDDIVVGTPIANRRDELTHSVMGFFANSLLLRTELRPDQTLDDVIDNVRATCTDAFANQDIPLDVIANALMPTRDLDRNPLYQVNFTLHNTPELVTAAGPITITEVPFDTGTSRFDLDLNMWQCDDASLAGYVEFASDLFDSSTVERLVRSFTALLAVMCADPARTVRDVPIGAVELPVLAGPVVDGEPGTIDASIEARAAERPDATAITDADGVALSYREFDDRVNRLANLLLSRGVRRGDLVGVHLPRSIDLVVALVAVARSGAAYVVVDPSHPADRRRHIVEDSGMVALIGRPAGSGVPAIDPADAAAAPTSPPVRAHGPDDVLYVMYTSGSTGSPKGVSVPHRGVANYLRWFTSVADLSDPRGVPLHTAAAVDLSVTSILGPLAAGGRVVLLAESATPGESLVAWVEGGGTTPMLKLTPSHLRLLTRAGLTERLSGQADALVIGGEALFESDVDELHTLRPDLRILNEYGPTEVSVACIAWDYVGTEVFDAVPIGAPIDNTAAYVLDERLCPVPAGVVGQLFVGGAGLAHGYHRHAAATAAAFRPDPFGGRPGARMYATGDRVRQLADGSLQYVGRTDEQVKVRGNRVELGEVRAALLAQPEVRSAAVLAEPGSGHSTELVAYVQLELPGDGVPAADERAGSLADERLAEWRSMYASTYGPLSSDDGAAEYAGWTDSYRGAAIPEPEMAQWRQAVVDRVLALSPEHVLEIGCGTGLILRSVAPHCLSYTGTDQSPEALDFVADALAAAPGAADVRLRPAPAHEAVSVVDADHPIDTVVINSVVQYFPSAAYARQVIEQCVQVMPQGGSVVIGDVRSLELLTLFHTSVALDGAAPSDRVADLRARAARLDFLENELCLSPAFFADLVEDHPRFSAARVEWRSAPADNELTRFRYDVVLTVSPVAAEQPVRSRPAPPREHRWTPGGGELESVLSVERPDALLVRDIPNARLTLLVAGLAVLATAHPADTLATVMRLADEAAAVSDAWHPSEAAELAARTGYDVSIELAADGRFAARFSRPGVSADWPAAVPVDDRTPRANDPLRQRRSEEALAAIRHTLARRLPPAMVPAVLVAVPAIPTTPGGKVDARALGSFRLVSRDTEADDRPSEAVAMTPVQAAVAGVWTELLGVAAPRVSDDFFALGGHSLLTFQLVYRLREALGVELPVRAPFQHPTLAGLSAVIEELLAGPAAAPAEAPVEPAWTGPPPASPAQERLWFVQQLDPLAFHYNVPVYAWLDGPLDVAALIAAIDGVVSRHATLRTVFENSDGVLRQIVRDPAPLAVERIDLSAEYATDSAVAQRHVHGLAESAYRRPFDLACDAPVRLSLITLTDERHVFLLTLHHIAYDAWSLKILFDEIADRYAAHLEGRTPVAPDLTTRYVDYALTQRRQLDNGSLSRSVEYWRRQLDGVTELTGLPLDHPRPVRPSFAGAGLAFRIDPETTAALRRVGVGQNATLFMLLVTALATALAERSGAAEVALGTDVANRGDTDLERLIGFFVNQVVLRCRAEPASSWRQRVAQVHDTVLDAFAHQDAPFDQVVRAVNPRRSREQSVLFGAKIVLNNAPTALGSLAGVAVAPLPFELRTARGDLTVLLEENDGGIDGRWEYDGEIFDAEGMARLCARFVALAGDLAAHPDDCPSAPPGTETTTASGTAAPAARPHRAGLRRRPAPVSDSGPDVTREPAVPATAGIASYVRRRSGTALADWASAHRADIEADLSAHGAVLFRGFGVVEPEPFEDFAAHFVDRLLSDNGEHPRAVIGGSGNVFTPVFFAPEEKLLWHNENTFNAVAPSRLFFGCAQVAETGGQTPIADARTVFDAVPDAMRERFLRLGVRYVRVYLPELGVPWQDVFGTSDRGVVEESCRRSGITWSWDEDTLRTECVRPAALRHPVSGDWCWTNQAQHWHPACLPDATRAALREAVGRDLMPRDCTYGDGSPIPDDEMRQILAVYAAHERSFDWQVGDVVMIDNVLSAHARNSYTGARRLLVTMGGEVDNR